MKLSPAQIDRLYQFTRQHYVEYYDLQTELVDHLANAIEAQWQENPTLDFETALQIEFKKFGVFGFMNVVEQRQAAMNKKYSKLVWQHFKAFFTIPKVMLTIGLLLVTYFFIKTFYYQYIFSIAMLVLAVVLFAALFIENRKIKKRKKETGKTWLFEQIIFNYGAFSGLLYLPLNFSNLFSRSEELPNNYVLFLVAFLIVSFYLVSYIIIKIIPSKAEQYLKETYPEYEMVK
ncbi:hypothetical protein [Flavobacterium sp.]|uniref:hypothetical protein n=1 Tax=Flavobacterium sp. TaxID=239 RepID=UPI00352717DC